MIAACLSLTCALPRATRIPLPGTGGRYTTEIGAKRVLAKTHGSIEAALDALFVRVPIAMAQRGDALVFDGPNGITAGVMWAGQVWAMTEQGARPIPDQVPLIAWRVE